MYLKIYEIKINNNYNILVKKDLVILYSQHSGSPKCLKCPENTYSMRVGAISCNNCSIGYVSVPERTGCICEKGFYYDNFFNCKKCSNGTYSNVEGSQSCFNCSAGYTSNDNHTDCILCPMGYYSNISGSTCEKFPIG